MAAPTLSFPPFPLNREAPTRMLKDFLHETNPNGLASSKPKPTSFKALAFHAVVAAVKRISLPSVKSPRIFPRSLSRRLLKKTEKDERETGGDFVVKVKDIIRWKSFRDLIDETTTAAPPLDFAESPDRYTYTAAATTTTTTTTTTSSSKSSSWCESDFTAEDLASPSWRDWSDDGTMGKMHFPCVGEDSNETTAAYAQNDDEIAINALPKREDNEEQEVLDESTRRLLQQVKGAILLSESCRLAERCGLDWLLRELFRRELVGFQDVERVRNSDRRIRVMNGKDDVYVYDWFLSHKGKESYVREMEREGKWEIFGVDEKIELGLEIEGEILGCLVDEILLDIFLL